MTKYHVNSDGNVGICRATVKACPIGPSTEHFSNKTEALKYAETKLAAELAVKKDVKSFLPIDKTRALAPDIPVELNEHREQALKKLSHLSRLEQVALRGYGGFAAGIVNSYFLGNKYIPYDKAPNWRDTEGPVDFNSQEELENYIQILDSVFSERAEQERILYRGIPIYKEIHKELEALIGEKFRPHETEKLKTALEKYYAVGKIFEYPTYLNTSHSAAVAAERTDNSEGTGREYWDPEPELQGIQLELMTSAGVDITGIAKSHYAREREVVLPRNMKFKVESVTVNPSNYSTSVGEEKEDFQNIAVVVQLREITP